MRGRKYLALFCLVVIVATMLVFQTAYLARARGMVWSWWVTRVGEVARVGPLTVENNVAEQLATLQAENARLRAELIDYRQLREQLGGGTAADFTPLPALVAARPLEPWQEASVINRGAVDGVV